MEAAGLKIEMSSDFSELYADFERANTMTREFSKSIASLVNSIPADLGKRLNFTIKQDNTSQAARDATEAARAKREEARATLDLARAEDVKNRAQERRNRQPKDLYAQLVADNQKLVREYYNAAAAIEVYGDAAKFTAQDLEEMRRKAMEGQQTLQRIEAGAGRFHRNVGNYASAFNPLSNSINQLTREMPAFANSLQTGFMAISNNIPALSDALAQIKQQNAALRAEGKPTVSMLRQVAGSLFSWNTALSVGITLLTVYGKDMVEWIARTYGASQASKVAAKATEDYNKALEESNVTLGQQIGELKALSATILSNNTSRKTQQDALNKLNKMYPEHLGNLSLEAARSGQLATIIKEQLVPALIASAKARAYGEKLNKLTTDEIKLQDQLAVAQKRNALASKEVNNQLSKQGFSYGAAHQVDLLATSGDKLTSTTKEIENLTNALSANRTEQTNTAETIAELMDQVNTVDPIDPGKTTKASKELRTYADVLKEYNLAIDEIQRKISTGIISTETEALAEKISAMRKLIIDATSGEIKDPLSIDDGRIVALVNNINDFETSIKRLEREAARAKSVGEVFKKLGEGAEEAKKAETQAEFLKITLKNLEEAFNGLAKQGIQFKPLHDAILRIKEEIKTEEFTSRLREFNDELQKVGRQGDMGILTPLEESNRRLQILNKELEYYIDKRDDLSANGIKINIEAEEAINSMLALEAQINSLVNDSLVKLTEALGEGLADAFDGGGIDAIFKSLGNSLGAQLQELGKILIKHGLAMEAIKIALQGAFANPAIAIGAGVAAIALGRLTQQALSKRARRMADGGVVYGSTFANVGEYSGARQNPEIVAPLNKLKSLIGDTGTREVPYIAETVIKGDDIRLVYQRAEKNFNR